MDNNKNINVEVPWNEWVKIVEADHLKAIHMIDRLSDGVTFEELNKVIEKLEAINQYVPILLKACEAYSTNIDDLLMSNTQMGMIIEHLNGK